MDIGRHPLGEWGCRGEYHIWLQLHKHLPNRQMDFSRRMIVVGTAGKTTDMCKIIR
jgi:hypothetical protein